MPKNPELFIVQYDAYRRPLGVEPADITLRDLFAAFALAGAMADPNAPGAKTVAKTCYAYADAMLLEREKKEPS